MDCLLAHNHACMISGWAFGFGLYIGAGCMWTYFNHKKSMTFRQTMCEVVKWPGRLYQSKFGQ